jgi:hypothetical protein
MGLARSTFYDEPGASWSTRPGLESELGRCVPSGPLMAIGV